MPKILFIVSDDRYFLTHRLSLARAALRHGYEVVVACDDTGYFEQIREQGFEVINLNYKRSGLNLLGDVGLAVNIQSLIRRIAPAVVHVISLRVSFLAALGRLFAFRKKYPTIYMITGLGHLFLSTAFKMRLIRLLVKTVFGLSMRSCSVHTVVQNHDDEAVFEHIYSTPRLMLIPGSGVDTSHFTPAQGEVNDLPIVTMSSRLIREKGVYEFVEAARLLKERRVHCRMTIVGGVHVENPSSLTEVELQAFQNEGLIEWRGRVDDVLPVLHETDIAVLPSYYREGLPKSLLEAASCGLPIVTTDHTGCRDAVEDGKTGILVPVKNSQSLADAIQTLVENPALRKQMGNAGRKRVLEKFSSDIINQQFIGLYDKLSAAS